MKYYNTYDCIDDVKQSALEFLIEKEKITNAKELEEFVIKLK